MEVVEAIKKNLKWIPSFEKPNFRKKTMVLLKKGYALIKKNFNIYIYII